MAHAERCPVCGGRGTVKEYSPYTTTLFEMERTCHGCQGKGWVTVED